MKKNILMLCALLATTLAAAQSYPHEPDAHVTTIEHYQKPEPAPAPETNATPARDNGQQQQQNTATVAKKEEQTTMNSKNTAIAEREN